MPATQPPVDSRAVRERLVEALQLDLVGPWAGHELDAEQLPGRERPSNWYVAGFLIPTGTPPERSGDADEDDDLDAVPESAGLAEESNDERKAARKAFFPSSIGLSFLVPAACRELAVTVRWGDYAPAEIEEAGGGKTPVWRRTAHEAALSVPLGGDAGPVVRDVPDSGGLQLHVVERPIGAMGRDGSELPAGTRSASCFLVNRRTPDEAQPDRAYAFQAEIEVRADEGFVPRPDLRGAHAEEWDDQVADLHYADTPEYATGHGVSAEWDLKGGGCRAIRTAWIGAAEVEKTAASEVPGVELSMEVLGRLDGGEAAAQALGPLVEQYRSWIEARRREVESGSLQNSRRETAEQLLDYATVAADRMASGVAPLAEDADLLDAFRGPLGTMAGLPETAIETLSAREVDGQVVKPKTVTSTATVRRVKYQIQSLFAWGLTQVGIAPQGRNPKVLMSGVTLPPTGAAQQARHEAGGDGNSRNRAEPYMTALVLGQPKVHADIQATSCVGRSHKGPGLVMTLPNVHKPPDRSHYEPFRHYHETFYRSVEAGSVTPFSPLAPDCGFAGALVAPARHYRPLTCLNSNLRSFFFEHGLLNHAIQLRNSERIHLPTAGSGVDRPPAPAGPVPAGSPTRRWPRRVRLPRPPRGHRVRRIPGQVLPESQRQRRTRSYSRPN